MVAEAVDRSGCVEDLDEIILPLGGSAGITNEGSAWCFATHICVPHLVKLLIISHQTTRTKSTPHLLSGSSLKPGMEAAAASHSSRTSTSWRGWPRSLSARWLAKSCAWIWRISVLSLGIYVKGECHAIHVFRLRVLSGRQALESSERASLRLDSSCQLIRLQLYPLTPNYPSATSIPALGYLHDKKADGGRAGDGGVPVSSCVKGPLHLWRRLVRVHPAQLPNAHHGVLDRLGIHQILQIL